jgi:deoxyribose-phosphate aldolase
MRDIHSYIDHTNLKSDASAKDIERLCNEAKTYGFYAVCVHGSHVRFAKTLLRSCPVKVCTVVGFPHGSSAIEVKVFETHTALKNGADEIDVVMNRGLLKSAHVDQLKTELLSLRKVTENHILKVIIESAELSDEDIEIACNICIQVGVDFIKTSTGFAIGGATIEAVKLIKSHVNTSVKIKASGGIKTQKQALDFINLGVDRIGTSSGIAIVNNTASTSTY